FQRLAFFGEGENIAKLTRYCLEHLYGDQVAADDAENGARLLDLVSGATARLAASYLAAGFVHGVLNSDNIAITGESFDYGPWRFTPDFDPEFTAAYFDYQGLYAFGRQPEAIQWDLAQLAGALTLISDRAELVRLVEEWGDRFEHALVEAMIRRLGVAPAGRDQDRKVAATLIRCLQTREAEIDRIFFDWRGGRDPGADTYPSEHFRALAAEVEKRVSRPAHDYWSDAQPCSMHIEEVEDIWSAIADHDDWSALERKVAAIRRMGEAMHEQPVDAGLDQQPA
ncbi:MAG: protein adenylyltransferase SelO family protein, partial [Sphingomicrobium sp.]